jgi:O-antigen/teichoic acid export membrane protein
MFGVRVSMFARNKWIIGDQALVSASNFLSSALLARFLGVQNFGYFSVFYVLLQYLNAIQLALIVGPLLTLGGQQSKKEQASFIDGMAGYQVILTLLSCGVLGVYALLTWFHILAERGPGNIWLPFFATVIFFQFQDWYRRTFYLRNMGREVFWNDFISYVGQIVVLAVLWWMKLLTIATAMWAIGATSLAATLAAYTWYRISPTTEVTKAAFRKTWKMGRDLLTASQLQWLGTQGLLLIVVAFAGVTAASGIRAAITLFGPVNVLFQLLDNVIPVKASQRFHAGGRPALKQYLRDIGIPLGFIIGIPILLVMIFAKQLMVLAFGKAFAQYESLIVWQGIYYLLGVVYRMLTYYYRTLHLSKVLARGAVVVACTSVTACVLLARNYGALGAMIALVLGQLLNTILPPFFARRERTRGSNA